MFDFILIAALWGGSFLFMRAAVPEFGPIALIAVRVAIAAAFLAPFAWAKEGTSGARANWKSILFVGASNYALPFCLLAYATLHVTAGFASILNSTAPLFTALVGWLWLKDRLSRVQLLGLILGFSGVVILSWGKLSFDHGDGLAIAAALCATFLYGVATHFTKCFMMGMSPLSLTAWGLAAAAVMLAPLGIWAAPPVNPSPMAWGSVIALGLACTALAFYLFFGLLAKWGATRTIAVGFLIPVFGMLWGRIFLGEVVTLRMVLGTAIIIAGTSLTSGLLSTSSPAR